MIELDDRGRPVSLEEKPAQPRFNHVVDLAAALKPSARGEYEIVDVIRHHMDAGALSVEQMGRGYAWLATGTHDSLLEASDFVRTLQHRQGNQVACLEEITFSMGRIGADQARGKGPALARLAYGQAILAAVGGEPRPFPYSRGESRVARIGGR